MEKIILNRKLKNNCKDKQLFNIDAFNSLERPNYLVFNKIERKLLIKEFSSGEKIYIQYPGKESNRENNKKRPFDFYPILTTKTNKQLDLLSFNAVWDNLYDLKKQNTEMQAFAIIFVHMAYMLDSGNAPVKRKLKYEDFDIVNKKVIKKGYIDFEWYEYSADKSILDEYNIPINMKIGNSSILPYLYCLDLIAQNEDCKYWYQAYLNKSNTDNEVKWKNRIGRINTCLTHASVTAFLENKMHFSELLNKMQHGVAPINMCKIGDITCNHVINK